MAMTPELLPENNTIIYFRAPPPSPVASGRRSSFANEGLLSDFLENSLKVPDLILPDRIFPRQKTLQNPPKLDFECLGSLDNESILKFIDSVSQTGCFEVFNHGVPLDLIISTLAAGAGIFRISPDKRKAVTRSLERPCGFEEFHGDEEKDISEEFVWCRDESLEVDMEGIWPLGYSNFSEKMEKLLLIMENVAEKILLFLEKNTSPVTAREDGTMDREFGSICCFQKHTNWQVMDADQSVGSLRYDVIRMLVRGSEFPHALCLHVCSGSQEFHVYSKKGWVSFNPDKDTLVITIGDQLQAWGRGQYKQVVGRPIFKGCTNQPFMSMAFLYSPSVNTKREKAKEKRTISIGQQIMTAIVFTLLYHFIVYTFQIFRD